MRTSRIWFPREYGFRQGECILIDTNVWVMLFAPPSRPQRWTDNYLAGVDRMLESKAQLIVTPIIVGEYINLYCEIERRAKAPHSTRKAFRNSGGFCRVQENVTDNVSQILQYSRYVDSPFPCQDMLRILEDFKTYPSDLNDLILVDNCRHNNWILYSDDSDFRRYRYDIDIVTCNPRLRYTE